MQYLVSVIADGTEVNPPGYIAGIGAFNDRLRAQGYWVFANGLAEPSAATVIDARGEEPVFTDPFTTSSSASTLHRSSPSTARSRSPSSTASTWAWPLLTVSTTSCPAITPTTRRAPTCCAGCARTNRRAQRTTKPSSLQPTPRKSLT